MDSDGDVFDRVRTVLDGLEHCSGESASTCVSCPYFLDESCIHRLTSDALRVVRELAGLVGG